jgi:hypothetical protein
MERVCNRSAERELTHEKPRPHREEWVKPDLQENQIPQIRAYYDYVFCYHCSQRLWEQYETAISICGFRNRRRYEKVEAHLHRKSTPTIYFRISAFSSRHIL